MADDSIKTEKELHGEGLYKYMSAERCFQVLSSKKIRFNSPLLFNDPFDVVRSFLPDISFSEIEKLKVPYVVKNILDGKYTVPSDFKNATFLKNLLDEHKVTPQTSEELTKKIMNEIDNNIHNFESKRPKIDSQWKCFLTLIRILCLSKNIKNIPLWYHYADNYKGAVISFNKQEGKIFNKEPVDVLYKPNLNGWDIKFWFQYLNFDPKVDILEIQKLLESMMKEKHLEWRYEEEIRLIGFETEKSTNGLLYSEVIIEEKSINSIYIGPNIDTQDKEKIISICRFNYPDAAIYQATIKNKLEFIQIN